MPLIDSWIWALILAVTRRARCVTVRAMRRKLSAMTDGQRRHRQQQQRQPDVDAQQPDGQDHHQQHLAEQVHDQR